jgi:hypothetical protein
MMLERRRIPRTRTVTAAKALTQHHPFPYGCSVRDVSSLGARLEFRTTATLPNIFELTFDAGRTLRICHVIWRTTTEVGVEFTNRQTAVPAPDTTAAKPPPCPKCCSSMVLAATTPHPIAALWKGTFFFAPSAIKQKRTCCQQKRT